MALDITLYTNPMSRGRIARWMLEELGINYDAKIVEYGPTMKSKEFLQLNPMGKVPVLVHGKTVVTEAAAICAYLAEAFPKAGLAPQAHERGAYYRWLFFAAGPLEAAVFDQSVGVTLDTKQESRSGYGNFQTVLNTLEHALSQNTSYIAGDRFTAADVYVGSHLHWCMEFKAIEPRKAFTQYWERIQSREARVRADKIDDELMAAAQIQNK